MRPMLMRMGHVESMLYKMIKVIFLRVPKPYSMHLVGLFSDKSILIKFTAVMLHGSSLVSLLSYKYKISSFWCS